MIPPQKSMIGRIADIKAHLSDAQAALDALNGQQTIQDTPGLEASPDYVQAKEALEHAQDALQQASLALEEQLAKQSQVDGIFHDIEQRFFTIFDKSPYAMSLTKMPEGTLVEVNGAFTTLFNIPRQEALGKTGAELKIADDESRKQVAANLEKNGYVRDFITNRFSKSGDSLILSLNLDWITVGTENYVLTTIRDITAQKQAEQALIASHVTAENKRQRLSAVMQALPVGVAILDAQGGNIEGNQAFEQIWGSPRPSADNVNDYQRYKAWWVDSGQPVQPEQWASAQAVQKGLTITGQQMKIQRFNGSYAYIRNSAAPIFDQQGKIVGCAVAIQDITEQQQSDNEIRLLNRTLKALSNSNQAMIHAVNEQDFLAETCRIIVDDCGFAMVWIGFADNDKKKSVRPAASAGFDQGYLDQMNITWANNVRGRGPTGTAIRTKKPSRCNNMLTDPKFAPWRKAAIERGYASSIVLPLLAGDRAFGALNIYSREPDAFTDAEEKLLVEMAADLAFGINTLRLRAEHARTEEAMHRSEERYRSLFDNMDEGFALHEIIYDEARKPIDYRFLEINDSFERLTGITRQMAMGQRASQVLPGLEPDWVERYGRVVLTGEPVQFEQFTQTLGRQFRVYAFRPAPNQFAIIFNDITEEKQIQLQLDLVAKKYATLFNSTSDGVWINNLDGVLLEVNQAYCEMSGYTSAELINMPVSRLEANESPHKIALHIQKLLDQKGHDSFESKHRRKDGSLFDVDITALYFEQEGGKIAIFVRDITERKNAEQHVAYLATFPEVNPRPITEIDIYGNIHYINPAASRLFPDLNDKKLAHEWLGDWATIVDNFKYDRAAIIMRDVKVADRFYQQSLNYISPQGLIRIYGLDITERKRAEQELRQTRDQLEQRVIERTQELNIANAQLRAEVVQRQKAQVELESSLQELQVIEEELRNNNEMLLDAQKVLDGERQRYQNLFDFAPDGYLVTDGNGLILEANQYAASLLEITHQSLIGKPLIVFISQSDHAAIMHLLATLVHDRSTQYLELKLLPRNGREITTAVTVASAKDRDDKDTLRWTVRDITERKHAEEIIRQNAIRNAVLSEISQALSEATMDEQAVVEIVAKSTASLVGDGCVINLASSDGQQLKPVAWYHTRPETLELMDSLFSANSDLGADGLARRVFETSQPALIYTMDAKALGSIPDGYRKYAETIGIHSLLIVPLQARNKNIGTISLIRNNTAHPYTTEDQALLEILANRTAQTIHNARLYQELQTSLRKELETHDQLVQTEKFAAVGRLLASITHEINNPLQTIKNCLYLTQMDTPTGTPASDALQIAVAETNRLSNLVAQLREIYRPPTMGQKRPVDLPSLLGEVQSLVAGYLQEKHVNWQFTPPDADVFSRLIIEGVPDQLKQVFLNICLNSIDAMEPEGGNIIITLEMSEGNGQVGISFRDTGPGIPPEVKDKLFEPFLTTKEKGLGLGLTICYDIIQKHNGSIVVISEPGKGAQFIVWLPIKRIQW